MFVVELFVPLDLPGGEPTPAATLDRIKADLTGRFGGVTSYLHSPAEGAWKPGPDDVVHDRVVRFEVMVETVDRDWWQAWREALEQELEQDQILARAHEVTLL